MFNEVKDTQWFFRAKHSWSKVNQALSIYMLYMHALCMFALGILTMYVKQRIWKKKLLGPPYFFILKLTIEMHIMIAEKMRRLVKLK